MIPVIPFYKRPKAGWPTAYVAVTALAATSFGSTSQAAGQTAVPSAFGPAAAQPAAGPIATPEATPSAAGKAGPVAVPATAAKPAACLTSGDGYLRAHLAGAIEADVDWPNSGTRCEGEPKY